jgi:hypothetical protein
MAILSLNVSMPFPFTNAVTIDPGCGDFNSLANRVWQRQKFSAVHEQTGWYAPVPCLFRQGKQEITPTSNSTQRRPVPVRHETAPERSAKAQSSLPKSTRQVMEALGSSGSTESQLRPRLVLFMVWMHKKAHLGKTQGSLS